MSMDIKEQFKMKRYSAEQKERLVDSLESAIELHCESATYCDDSCCQILNDLKTILELLKNKLTE